MLRNAALLCLLLPCLAQGAGASAPARQDESLDEVVVKGTRSELDELRNEMVLVEDRFYERYNELNPNHDFDTHCQMEARIGTNTKRRYCRAVYQERAQQKEGQEYAEALKNMNQDPPQPWVPPTTADDHDRGAPQGLPEQHQECGEEGTRVGGDAEGTLRAGAALRSLAAQDIWTQGEGRGQVGDAAGHPLRQ